jgi:ABC-type transport system involved in multi-copper enzyme maturation permease subunit
MSPNLRPPGHLGIALLLMRRELAARLMSPWLYAVASLVCVIAWFYGGGFLRAFETESVLVTTDPLAALNVIVVVVLGVVLGLRLAASLAWEREHRTLEVLLAGPVSHGAILLAKFCVELLLLALLVTIYAAYLLVAQPLGAGVVGPGDAAAIGRMPLHALPVLALGLLASAWARSVRGAVVAYLAIVLLLGLFEIVLGMLLARQPQELGLVAVYLRGIMSAAAPVIDPVSAVARLADLTQGLTVQTPLPVLRTLMAVGLALVTLALATLVSRARGAV